MTARAFSRTVIIAGSLSLAAGAALADSAAGDPLHTLSHLFENEAIIGEPTLVDCKLSGGAAAKCFAITVAGSPVDHTPGPWCPPNIKESNKAGGTWLENDKVYALVWCNE